MKLSELTIWVVLETCMMQRARNRALKYAKRKDICFVSPILSTVDGAVIAARGQKCKIVSLFK